MSHCALSADELVAILKRTSLPTLVAEGNDDAVALRFLEERVDDLGVSVLPVGGRDKLLTLFQRRSEFTNTKSAFIADLDVWLFGSGVPAEFDHELVCFTDGYSIENDVFRDGELEKLLKAAERKAFQREVQAICPWFSDAVERILAGADDIVVDISPHALLDPAGRLKAEVVANMRKPNAEFVSDIESDFSRKLRGKTLFALLLRQLSHRERTPKYSRLSLLEMGASRYGPYMQRLEAFVRGAFATDGSAA